MDTSIAGSEIFDASPIFRINQDEALNKDGHQNWHRLILHSFNGGLRYEAVIHKYETWSESSDLPEQKSHGVRGKGDIERNRERAARRAKRKIRFACKSAGFDRMVTLTTRQAIFDRDVFQKMMEKFIRLVRKATGDSLSYVLVLEKHDSEKTAEAKRGSLHAHVALRGRQDYKLLQAVWNYRVCGGRGYVRVTNGSRKLSSSRIAGYISKYASKSISDVAFNKKSYWISHHIDKPERTVMLFKTQQEAFSFVIKMYLEKGLFSLMEVIKGLYFWCDDALGVVWIPAG